MRPRPVTVPGKIQKRPLDVRKACAKSFSVFNRKEEWEAIMSATVREHLKDIHLNSLLAATFSHPSQVLSNPILSASEKRCVLAAWASDAFAVESCPWLRQLPSAADPVPIAEIRLDDGDDPPPRHGGAARMRPPCPAEPAMAVGFSAPRRRGSLCFPRLISSSCRRGPPRRLFCRRRQPC